MKHDRPQRLGTSLALCGAIALAVAFGPSSATSVRAQPAPPPPPPAPNSTIRLATPAATFSPVPVAAPVPTLSPTPEPKGRKKRGKPATDAAPAASAAPEPSATPTSPAFATLDGTWEFQLQYIDRTEYSYLTIAQGAAGTITGTWKVAGNNVYPFEGTYDGRLIKLTVKKPTGNVTMSGYVEGASDMVGIVDLTLGKTDPTAFTAEHRASSKGSIFKKGV
ncbi:MAG: hypothetical protein NVSMB19_25230 [Vulcanimicrobiaceae bacterium]